MHRRQNLRRHTAIKILNHVFANHDNTSADLNDQTKSFLSKFMITQITGSRMLYIALKDYAHTQNEKEALRALRKSKDHYSNKSGNNGRLIVYVRVEGGYVMIVKTKDQDQINITLQMTMSTCEFPVSEYQKICDKLDVDWRIKNILLDNISNIPPYKVCDQVTINLKKIIPDLEYKVYTIFGAGEFGIVFGVHKKGHKRALKLNTNEDYEQEYKMHGMFASHDLAPKRSSRIYKSPVNLSCSGYIMQQITADASDIFTTPLLPADMSSDVRDIQKATFVNQLVNLITGTADAGMIHADLNLGNVAFMNTKLVLIDFGWSTDQLGPWPTMDIVSFLKSAANTVFDALINGKRWPYKNISSVLDFISEVFTACKTAVEDRKYDTWESPRPPDDRRVLWNAVHDKEKHSIFFSKIGEKRTVEFAHYGLLSADVYKKIEEILENTKASVSKWLTTQAECDYTLPLPEELILPIRDMVSDFDQIHESLFPIIRLVVD